MVQQKPIMIPKSGAPVFGKDHDPANKAHWRHQQAHHRDDGAPAYFDKRII
jgi:hypothetical protein